MNTKDTVALLKQTIEKWTEDRASLLAAALAYYTLFSLAPLLIIAITVASQFVSGQVVQMEIRTQITRTIGPETADFILNLVGNLQQTGPSLGATVIGVATLLLGSSGVFAQLQNALDVIWDVEPGPDRGILGTVQDRLLTFVMVLGVGVLLVAAFVLSTVVSSANTFLRDIFTVPEYVRILPLLDFLVSFAMITVLFAVIYKVLPRVQIKWRDVWVGAAATSLLFNVGKWLISFYLSTSGAGSAYGAAGSLIVLLLFIYYSAQIVLMGAEFTQVYANRLGSRILPAEGAIATDGEEQPESVAAPAGAKTTRIHPRLSGPPPPPSPRPGPEQEPAPTGTPVTPSLYRWLAAAVTAFVVGIFVGGRR